MVDGRRKGFETTTIVWQAQRKARTSYNAKQKRLRNALRAEEKATKEARYWKPRNGLSQCPTPFNDSRCSHKDHKGNAVNWLSFQVGKKGENWFPQKNVKDAGKANKSLSDSGPIEATPDQIFRCLLVSKVQKIHRLDFLILLRIFTKFDQVPGFINLPDFETAGSARPGSEACKGHGQEERLACSQGRVGRKSERGTFFLFIGLWEHPMSSKEV